LGTLVGTIVVAYTLWNVYKYRDDGSEPKEDFDAPEVGGSRRDRAVRKQRSSSCRSG